MGSQKEKPHRDAAFVVNKWFNMNETLLITLLCAVLVVALMMAGLGVKMLVRKNGEFKRHCSGMDPYTGESAGCVCGKAVKARCEKRERYSPLEVNRNLMDEVEGGNQ